MLFYHLRIALRGLKRSKGYALINVVGLALGVAVCVLILVFVRHELSYDAFHQHADRLYRLVWQSSSQGETALSVNFPPALAPTIAQDLPELEAYVRFRKLDKVLLSSQSSQPSGAGSQFYEDGFLFADSTFLEVYSFKLLRGNPGTALLKPFSVLLTPAMARKYFGSQDPVGSTLVFDNAYSFEVTGIIENASNSSIQFNFVAPFATLRGIKRESRMVGAGWYAAAYATHLLLSPSATPASIEAKLPAILQARTDFTPILEAELYLEPLTDVHLFSAAPNRLGRAGDPRYVYIFSTMAVLILVIACINYTNLATAQSARRALEIGVRKAIGAWRGELTRQFLSESVVLALVALPVAYALIRLLLPWFNNQLHIRIDLAQHVNMPLLVLLLFGLGLVVGLLAGGYPALVLSQFRPVEALKGVSQTAGRSLFRKGLVVFQFAVAVALIACTLVIARQLQFVHTRNLGFDDEQVVVVPLRDEALQDSYGALRLELEQISSIVHVTGASSPFGEQPTVFYTTPEGGSSDLGVNTVIMDFNFVEVLGLDVVTGRAPSPDRRSDAGTAVWVNEAAVKAFAWTKPLGKHILGGEVIGVVKDFHYMSLHQPIEPLVLSPSEGAFPYILARLQTDDVPGTLAAIEKVYRAFSVSHPFAFSFLDQDFEALYRAEQRLKSLFSAFTLLTILIACLGLLGLAAYSADRRTKEIGVRKVFGASTPGIVVLLLKDFLKLIGMALLLAFPVAYFAMHRWLQGFAYRTDVGLDVFLVSGILVGLIALVTISYQVIKAARANPVQSLRYE